MNICHFISSKGLGRGEFYIDLVNEMVIHNDIKITLLIPKEAKFLQRVSNKINIIEYKSKDSRNNPFLYYELFNIFRLNQFDLVHTHFAKSSEIFYRLNKFFKLTHVATKHNPRKGKIFNKLQNVTAVSNDVAKSIKNKNVKVIFNGINPINIKNTKKNNVFTIRAIGRLDKIKGFDKLINEFSKVEKDCILEIIGDGNERKNLQKLIDDNNLNEKVKLVGFRTDIPNIISSSDIVIMTSLSEGFSIVMIETLFYGKLFISTPVSGCKDILSDKLLIHDYKISEKIINAIENYESYLSEYKKIKDIYQNKFLLSKIVNQYINYYKFVKGIK